MASITKELLRRRAEHNEMMLTNLEEITLHQEELVKIENLDVHCRHLKILLLQNNIIERIENLHKLKELEYLNLALNNIKLIENLEQCESLQKLDLTLNFVNGANLEASVKCLSQTRLKELYLTGNPCTDWKGYRDYVVAQVDSLQTLDGKEITHTERIKAKQALPMLQQELLYFIVEEEIKQEQKAEQEKTLKEEGKQGYTPEVRREMYLKMAQEKEEKDRRQNPDKYKVKETTPMFLKDGKIRQCDEGGYKPYLNQWDDPDCVIFKMNIPKFLDTSLIEVNLDPNYVSVRVKGKLTQLRLDEEIFVEKSTILRSEMTGELVIKMPKVHPNLAMKEVILKRRKREQEENDEKLRKQQEAAKLEKQRVEKLIQQAQAKQALLKEEDIPELE